jgi:hypothetical protein
MVEISSRRYVVVREIRADGMLICEPDERPRGRSNDHRQEDRRKLLHYGCTHENFTIGEVEAVAGSRCIREFFELLNQATFHATELRRSNSEAQVFNIPRAKKLDLLARLGMGNRSESADEWERQHHAEKKRAAVASISVRTGRRAGILRRIEGV